MSLRRPSGHYENILTVGVDYLHSLSLNSEQGEQMMMHPQRSVRQRSMRNSSSRIVPLQEISNNDVEAGISTPAPDGILADQKKSSTKSDHDHAEFGSSASVRVQPPNPIEETLPLTESRNANIFYVIFHLICSGVGTAALLLPYAFKSLGWGWGISVLAALFAWQLYTTWLLVNLHYSHNGTRYSRYIQVAMVAFGPGKGKLFALFPVMYLSGGACVILTMYGALYMKHFYQAICDNGLHCNPTAVSGIEWTVIFMALAIIIGRLPNLNSVAWVSFVGSLTALTYCTMLWLIPVLKGRPHGVSYTPTSGYDDETGRVMTAIAAIGFATFSFKGHNVILEIQGTLPPSENPEKVEKTMWRGVILAYTIIGACLLAVSIGGYWAYGSHMTSGGLLTAFIQFHYSRNHLIVIYFMIIVSSLCQFQVYAMVLFDNLELRYVAIKGEPATGTPRTLLRCFFGVGGMFVACALPFIPKLSSLVGSLALPLTFVLPCFFWLKLNKPERTNPLFWINWILGCSGVLLSVLIFMAAIWNLVEHHFHANFFHPR